MERINILHLSDAHITKLRSTKQQIVLDAFIDDLKRMCNSDLAPNYVVLSGDLVNNPDEDGAYDHFLEVLLIRVVEVTSVDLDNFVFCSGNHDVSRKACQRFALETDAIAANFGNHKYFNDLYAAGQFSRLFVRKWVPIHSF